MSASAVRILVVGPLTEATSDMSQRLERHGWATHCVASLREAQIVLSTIRFPLVLAAEKLEDGAGYELTEVATRLELTLVVGLQLTETLLWLPVVEAGERSLGSRALNPVMLEGEVERILTAMDAARASSARERLLRSASGPVLRELSGATAAGRKKQNAESKTVVPPLRGPKKATPAVTTARPMGGGIDRATGTHGKHWRG
jgi:DNA-binding NtrC family response regulator